MIMTDYLVYVRAENEQDAKNISRDHIQNPSDSHWYGSEVIQEVYDGYRADND